MIKTIIFDFGDVFINLDKEATAREMTKFGFEGLSPALFQYIKSYEVGAISTSEFISKMLAFFPSATPGALEKAWKAIILEFPEYRLTYLEELVREGRFKLILLSNTNELHIEEVRKKMGDMRYKRFQSCFDAFYLSHEIGLRKPDSAIYEFVLKNNKLLAEECLFVDDLKDNTLGAERLGIKTWNLLVGKEDIIMLDRYLSHV